MYLFILYVLFAPPVYQYTFTIYIHIYYRCTIAITYHYYVIDDRKRIEGVKHVNSINDIHICTRVLRIRCGSEIR